MAGTTVITVPRIQIAAAATLTAGDLSSINQNTVEVGTALGVGFIPPIGTAPGSVNWIYNKELLVSSSSGSGPLTIDVTSGLLDSQNNVLPSPARILGIWGENLSAVSGEIITVTGGISNPLFNLEAPLYPNVENQQVGGVLGLWTGYPGFVVDGTHKTIEFSCAMGINVPFNLVLYGCTV
jgi:hypothetical protein